MAACKIELVEKRRAGGSRYWCLAHKADATAKHGRRADACRYAHVPPVDPQDVLLLDVRAYPGGIALWGAVPPVYDTTELPVDRGIHVHARVEPGGPKVIDATRRGIRLAGLGGLPGFEREDSFEVSEVDAIYYMVTAVLGLQMKYTACTYCGYAHLDKDWFSVHPHQRHLCSGCGRQYHDTDRSIGNPLCLLRDAFGRHEYRPVPADRTLSIRQTDYPGGIRIWGSNPAVVWTGERSEEEGIHVHAFAATGAKPALDDTYAEVRVDGIRLDPQHVRNFMAQRSLPHAAARVVSLTCPGCNEPHFDVGADAFTPLRHHRCSRCKAEIPLRGRARNVIANPLVRILAELKASAPRPPQHAPLDLIPETPPRTMRTARARAERLVDSGCS